MQCVPAYLSACARLQAVWEQARAMVSATVGHELQLFGSAHRQAMSCAQHCHLRHRPSDAMLGLVCRCHSLFAIKGTCDVDLCWVEEGANQSEVPLTITITSLPAVHCM